MNEPEEFHGNEVELAAVIKKSTSEKVVRTRLMTDERVIARVTDGIYRQPGSALRELISNAYDADASRVVIKTDRPRFNRITVEDNGRGMNPEALANLIRHIGGSAKRNDRGAHLGIAAEDDPTRSPGGRKLIGKIGIGLFSVSQLTSSFQIITKVKGDSFRTIAVVALRQYSDEPSAAQSGDSPEYESGKVNIWREPAADVETQGTTIVLNGIRPQARDTLRSREIWAAIERNEDLPKEEKQAIEPPAMHIGRVDATGELFKLVGDKTDAVPWDAGDAPADAFAKLVESVWQQVNASNPNPQLEKIFDYYLRMVWQLGLAIPVPYVQGHLFDLDLKDWASSYLLSNKPKGGAVAVPLEVPGPVRNKLSLTDPYENGPIPFEVIFDELQLLRPVKFKGLPSTQHQLKDPIVFIGKCREEFAGVDRELSGGPLDFEAYLIWTPKVAPTEHQGSLIRIHGSSGTLFDPTFMRYQTAELTRSRQITCEIFVKEGLDSALNIDRESFNNAHPHVVFVTKWLHGALRQLATVQKKLASEIRDKSRTESKTATLNEIQQVATDLWQEEADDPAAHPPPVEISEDGTKTPGGQPSYVFKRSSVVHKKAPADAQKNKARDLILEEKLKAIAQVLASFGLLDAMPKRKQERLLKAIYQILDAAEG